MIRTAAALFSVALVLCTAVSAQAPVQGQPNQSFATGTMVTVSPNGQRTTTVVMIHIDSCPVGMQAKQRGLTELVKTRRTPPPDHPEAMPRPTQHIHLILNRLAKDKQVTSAVVTARGLSARTHMQNANLAGEGSSDIRRTLTVTFTPDQDGSVSADIDLPAFTAVRSLQLESITYADGSSWTPEKNNACTVQPDSFMLIAAQ